MSEYQTVVPVVSILIVAVVILPASAVAGAEDTREASDDQFPEYYPTSEVSEDELADRSLREISLMRNTIFARAGHEFSTTWLQDYFDDRDWYEGGGLDDGEFSALDRHNVQTIRDFENGLSERSLRSRRQDHWSSHELPSDGQWEPPGPFEEDEDVVEAKLIDEALEELLDETGAYRRSIDPGDHDFGESEELPDGFGEFRLGQRHEASDQRDVEGSVTTVEPLGSDHRVVPVLDDGGRIQQLSTLIDTYEPDDVGEEFGRLAPMTRLATRLSRSFGEPEVLEESDLSGYQFVETLRWEGDGRVVDLDNAVEMGGGKPPRVVLHTGEADRICGADDGFKQWYEDFEEAAASDDPGEVVGEFSFPFTDEGPGAGAIVRDHTSRRIEDRDTFLERDEIGGLRPGENSDPMCVNARSGYGVWMRDSAVGGALRFYRIDGEWRVVGLTTTPF